MSNTIRITNNIRTMNRALAKGKTRNDFGMLLSTTKRLCKAENITLSYDGYTNEYKIYW